MSNTKKHTPGPWKVSPLLSASENHRGFHIISPDGWRLAQVQPYDEDGVQGGANAQLIAAAPELLEALEAALAWYMDTPEFIHGDDSMPMDTFNEAHDAIAKARGQA